MTTKTITIDELNRRLKKDCPKCGPVGTRMYYDLTTEYKNNTTILLHVECWGCGHKYGTVEFKAKRDK
jgi:DNA-binding HxlR family transcriptional regulator